MKLRIGMAERPNKRTDGWRGTSRELV